MPLSPKGKKIMSSMKKTYGAKKAKKVFYASRNSGRISGVDRSGSQTAARPKTLVDY